MANKGDVVKNKSIVDYIETARNLGFGDTDIVNQLHGVLKES